MVEHTDGWSDDLNPVSND